MKKKTLLFIVTLLFLVVFSSAQNTQLISLSKSSYTLGETIDITLDKETIKKPGVSLEILAVNGVYKYSGEISHLVVFDAKQTGTYTVMLKQDSIVLEKKVFEVVKKQPKNISANIEKETYSLGEQINISLISEEDFKVEVIGEKQQSTYFGLLKNVVFTPKQKGGYLVLLKDLYDNILSTLRFEVEENTPNPTIQITPTSKQDIPDDTIVASQEPETTKKATDTLKVKDSKNRVRFVAGEIKEHKKFFRKTNDLTIHNYSRKVKNITFKNIRTQNPELGFEEVRKEVIQDAWKENKNVVDAYAVDPTSIDFDTATITLVATGSELYKCAAWNFTEQTCYGEWVKIKNLIPGEEYELLITPDDPGFAETGISTINTHKPIYYPNETAIIYVAVVDNQGFLVADANITLNVTTPTNQTYTLFTPNKVVEVERGVYKAEFNNTQSQGNYTLYVYATAQNTNASMTSKFLVKSFYEFEIIRDVPFSIDPWLGPFTTSIEISPYINNTGNINLTELIPTNLSVVDSGGAVVVDVGYKKELRWENISPNSIVYYELQAPLVAPDLYTLGPAVIRYVINSSSEYFVEARPWYIAADPLWDLNATTCDYMNAEAQDNRYYTTCTNLDSQDADGGNSETVTAGRNKWAGVRVIANKVLTNCAQVERVEACTNWWIGGDWKTCVGVDVSITGVSGSFTNVDSSCPTSDGGVSCVNITGTFSWNCSSWQNSNVVIRAHAGNDNDVQTATFDAAFFRVNYTEYSDPPTPLSWAKNESMIYQNMYVTFNSTWSDDEALDSWVFSINQNGTWWNTSFYQFTSNNVSNYSINITAPAATTVYWKFYANDSQSQWNSTPTQSFSVAGIGDNTSPTINWVNATPIIDISGTVFNLTANITDDVSVSSANADILLSNGTRQNCTMSGSGDIWSCLYTSTFGGEFSFFVWATDGSSNTNYSSQTAYFNVTPIISTDKTYYSRGEIVQISGFGFSQTNTITIDIKKRSTGQSVSSYPKPISTGGQGNTSDPWTIPSVQTLVPGNYTITINDSNSSILYAQRDVIVIFRPSLALLTDRDNTGLNVLSEVNETDNSSRNIVLKRDTPTPLEERIEVNFTDNVPIGYDVNQVIFGYEHQEDNLTVSNNWTTYIKVYNSSSGAYEVACSFSPSTTNRVDTCNLTSWINTYSEANSVSLWITDNLLAAGHRTQNWNLTYVNFTYLDIQYNLSATTTVVINEPSYDVNSYDYTDNNNKAYHGVKTEVYATLLTGTEASVANYTYLETNDESKYNHSITGNNNQAYHSLKFKIGQSPSSVYSLRFNYDGHTEKPNDGADTYTIWVWNFTAGSYQNIYTSSSTSSDVSASPQVTGNISDFVNSSSYDVWFLVESTPATNGAGDGSRYIFSDYAALDVLQFPTLTGWEYINVTAIDSDGISSCNYSFRTTSLNGSLNFVSGYIWNGSTNTALITDGFYWFDAVCLDNVSNQGNDTIYVRISNTPPSVLLIYPPNIANMTTSTFDVQFNATSQGGGPISCNLTLNGVVNNTDIIFANSGEITNYTLTNLPDNDYYWNVTCWQDISNTNTSSTWLFTVDTTGPNITLDYPQESNSSNTTNITFLFTPYDMHGLNNCSIYLDGVYNNSKNSSNLTNGALNNFSINNIFEGWHYWSVNCSDIFNNSYQTPNTNFTVDLTPPNTTLLYPNSSDIFGFNDIEFNFTVTDNLDSLLQCNITIDGININSTSYLDVINNTIESNIRTVVNGLHWWNVTCWDDAGWLDTSQTWNFTVQGPPLPILVNPQNYTGGFLSENGTFTYNATDDSGIDNCSIYVDGNNKGNDSAIEVNQYNYFNVTNINEGNHTWNVSCTNGAGTGWSKNWIFWVDETDPNVNLIYPGDNNTINSSTVTLQWNATDDLTDNLSCDLRINSDFYPNIISPNNTIRNYTLFGLTDNDYYWNVTCSDRLGRTNISNSTWVFHLNAGPTINLEYPSEGDWVLVENITFEYTPIDSSGIANCTIFLDDAPSDNSTNITSGVTNNFTLYNVSEGIHNWTVECFDNSSQSTKPGVINFSVDFNDPFITPKYPNASTIYNSWLFFEFNVYDAVDEIVECTINISDYGVSGPFFANASGVFNNTRFVGGLSNGVHYYNITCTDDANRNGTSVNLNFSVDIEPYVVLVEPISYEGKNDSNVTFYYNATDVGGIQNCSLYLNDAYQYTQGTINITNGGTSNFTRDNLAEGLYNWSVNCTDVNNSVGNSSLEWFYVDKTAPLWVNLTFPEENDTIHTTTINFNFTAYDEITQTLLCDLYINEKFNITVNATSGNWTNISRYDFGEGSYNWSVECTDSSQLSTTSETWYFNVSFTPEVTLIAPPPYSWNNTGNVTFYYLPEDNNLTLQYCHLYLDGSVNYSIERYPNANQIDSWTENGFSEGFHTWYWDCTDWDNNTVNSTETWNFTVDLTNPTINLITPDNDVFNISTILFNLTAWDNLAPNTTCNISLDSNVIAGPTVVLNGSYFNHTEYNVSDGLHYWNATCTDLASNTNISLTYNFTVNEPPRINLGNPQHNNRTNEKNITFFFTPYDNSNNISNCTLILNGLRNETNNNISVGVENNITAYNFADGIYNWTVNCTDAYGLEGTNQTTKTLIVDLYPPTINRSYPGDNITVPTENVNFNWTANDTWSSIVYCNLTVDGAVNATNLNFSSGDYHNHTVYGLVYGSHNWSLLCWDDLGNYNTTSTWNFTVEAPDLYTDNTRIWFNNSNPDLGENLTIYLNVTNNGASGSSNFLVQFWQGPPGIGVQIGNNISLSLSPGQTNTVNTTWIINQGYYSIYGVVNPDLGVFETNYSNNNATINISVLWANLTSPPSPTWTSDLTPLINFTLYDYTNSSINYSVLVNGVPNGQNGSVTDNVSQLLNLSTLNEGIRLITIRVTDYLNRTKDSNTITLYIDNTSAVVNYQAENNSWFNTTTPNIIFNITDALDDNINYSLYVDQGFITSTNITNNTNTNQTIGPLSEGYHNVTIETLDEANNIANYTLVIIVDITKPTINLTNPVDQANITSSSATLNFTVSDNLDDPILCNITLDGSQVYSQNISNNSYGNHTANNLFEGVHSWNVTCIDEATNFNVSETKTFNVFRAPNITLVTPPTNSWFNDGNITFYFNVSDETGIENCSLLIDGNFNQSKPGSQITNNATNNITSEIFEGSYNWSITCFDNTTFYSQGFGDENRSLYIDLTPSFANITTKNESWFNTASPLINFLVTDNMDLVLNYYLYVNSTLNASGTTNNNTPDSDNLNALTNGSWSVVLEAVDEATNKYNSTPITIYVDTVLPSITLTAPENDNLTNNDTVFFNFTVSDNMAPILSVCNLTIDSNNNQSFTNITSGSWANISVPGLGAGIHYWNVTCVDLAGNTNTSLTYNFTVPAPDLVINAGNISFSNNNPVEGENITVLANIYNVGGATANNFVVQFWQGNPDTIGVQIGVNQTINSLVVGSNQTLSVNWTTKMGTTRIYVVVDPPIASNGSITESDESNNKAYKAITISGHHVFAGNTTSILNIDNSAYNTLFSWNKANSTGDNLFVADYDSSVSWTSLLAIGKNTSNSSEFDDFAEIDTALNMTNYTDSINNTYTQSGSAKNTKNYIIFTSTIYDVPVINSTVNNNFLTGILWDSNDGPKYNGTQDLVFVTEVNENKIGFNGTYDFEIKVPAALREYKTPDTSAVAFYAEIK
ncbi:hypothetical protein GOV05_01115 [Candidatus Woesearchaeota archaeon]|nr:hypothetical protein [Candidatus Woesearchaeota archaeon]